MGATGTVASNDLGVGGLIESARNGFAYVRCLCTILV